MKGLTEILLNRNDADSLKIIFQGLFTPQEIATFDERIQILKRLKAGESQRKISEDLGVSIATVTRGNRVLRYDNPEITNYL